MVILLSFPSVCLPGGLASVYGIMFVYWAGETVTVLVPISEPALLNVYRFDTTNQHTTHLMSFAYTSIPGATHTKRSLITTLYTLIVFYGRYTETGAWDREKYTWKGELDVFLRTSPGGGSPKERQPPARE